MCGFIFILFIYLYYMDIPVLYINLDRSEQRNLKMVESLNKLNVNHIRVQGIDSHNLNKNALKEGEYQGFKYVIRQNLNFKPREKEIAIILSHIKALNKIIENNFDIAIVMEDDLSFQYVDDWNKQISNIITNAPKDWKILKLHTSTPQEVENNIALLKNIYYVPMSAKAIQSAGCYIIKRSTVVEILEKYRKDGIYTFPHGNEFCVCECIIFSVQIFIYILYLSFVQLIIILHVLEIETL